MSKDLSRNAIDFKINPEGFGKELLRSKGFCKELNQFEINYEGFRN